MSNHLPTVIKAAQCLYILKVQLGTMLVACIECRKQPVDMQNLSSNKKSIKYIFTDQCAN